MATIASIDTAVRANTQHFERGMRRSRKALGGFQSSITGTLGSLRRFAGLLAGGFTAGAFIASIKKSANEIDALAKQADVIGIATEQYQRFRLAADLAGVSNEALNKSFLKMVRTVTDAASGEKEYAEALERIGLKAADLVKLAPEQQFLRIADAIESLTNQNAKIQATFDIFGKSGPALLNFISGGSSAIREAVREAERLGVGINRIDAAKVEAANDAFTKFGATLRAISERITVQLAPLFEFLSDVAANTSIRIREAFAGSLPAMRLFGEGLEVLRIGFLGLRVAAIGTISAILDGFTGMVDAIINAVKKLDNSKVGLVLKALPLAVPGGAKLAEALAGPVGGAVETGAGALDEIKSFGDGLRQVLAETRQDFDAAFGGQNTFDRLIGLVEDAVRRVDERVAANLRKPKFQDIDLSGKAGAASSAKGFQTPLFASTALFGSQASFEARRRAVLGDRENEDIKLSKSQLDELRIISKALRAIESRDVSLAGANL